ncbi:hypothetical protein V1498_02570 [Peribacillus sp. SCS-26]|uniref:hypothetical protein n=1 Tax=Paraperibacillus marinus TaxID=3115295 RepID=UPI003905A2EB
MEVELGFIPKTWIAQHPDAGSYFPFAIDGEKSWIVDISSKEEDIPAQFISGWMERLDAFPIYLCFQIFEFHQEELEQDFKLRDIQYEKLGIKGLYYKAVVKEVEDFEVIFPYLYSNGCMNNLALWSLHRDIFSSGKRGFQTLFGNRHLETPIVTLGEADTVFWVSYDGGSIISISNDQRFADLNDVSRCFPPATSWTEVKYKE